MSIDFWVSISRRIPREPDAAAGRQMASTSPMVVGVFVNRERGTGAEPWIPVHTR